MEYRILTSGRLADQFYKFVKANFPSIQVLKAAKQEIKSLLPEVNAIAGFNFLTEEDISHIKWIHAFGAGVDSYLRIPSLSRDTVITRTTGDLGRKMGEFCLAQILAELKSLFPLYENQRSKSWNQIPTSNLYDQKVLVLGTGSIGRGIAQQLQGHVKKIIGLNRSNSPVDSFDEIVTWETLGEQQDINVVIGALPSTSKTSTVLNADFFKKFENVIFINVGRGDSVDETGLLKSIELGHIRRAVLDVFSTEPLPAKSPLWINPKVTISPHQSGLTTIDDVAPCFKIAYQTMNEGTTNDLFIDREKEY